MYTLIFLFRLRDEERESGVLSEVRGELEAAEGVQLLSPHDAVAVRSWDGTVTVHAQTEKLLAEGRKAKWGKALAVLKDASVVHKEWVFRTD